MKTLQVWLFAACMVTPHSNVIAEMPELPAASDSTSSTEPTNQSAAVPPNATTTAPVDTTASASATTSTPASTPTVTTIAPPAQALTKDDIDKLNAAFTSITTSKAELNKILSSLDSDLEQAKTLLAEAHKKSIEILKQSTPEAGQKISDEIKVSFDTITSLQQKAQTQTTKSFDEKAEAIKKQITDAESLISVLQAKDNSIKVHHANQEANNARAAAPRQKKHKSFKNWFVAERNANTSLENTDPTFIHYILKRIADVFSALMRIVYGAWQGAYNAFSNATHEKPVVDKNAKDPAASQMPTTKASSSLALLQPIEKAYAAIESVKDVLSDSYNNVCRMIHTLSLALASYPEISSQITELSHALASTKSSSPAWKEAALSWFSNTLDGAMSAFEWTQRTSKRIYRSYIQPAVTKITTDLNTKMARKKHVTNTAGEQEAAAEPVLPHVQTKDS
jgi:hypothetical protein